MGRARGHEHGEPQVAGGAALLNQQHPGWTVAQIKSALVQTGDPVRHRGGPEASAPREGGGLIDLPRANDPLLFASPTSIAFPVNGGSEGRASPTREAEAAPGRSTSCRSRTPPA